jgi:hypothetical protein
LYFHTSSRNGIDPGQLLVVDPRLARARVDDGQLGTAVGEDVVLEGHDARDRVDAARLEIGHQGVEVLERAGTLRSHRERLRHLGTVEDPAPVALHVDHDRVDLGARGQVEHAAADLLVADAEVGEVRGLDHLRLHDDLDRVAGGREDYLREAGPLDEQRRVGRVTLDGELALGVRPMLDAADDDRGALEWRAVCVKDLTTDHLWPGDARRLGRALDRLAEILADCARSGRWTRTSHRRRAGDIRRSQHRVAGHNRNDEKPGSIGSVQKVATTIRRRALVTHRYFRQ